MKRQARLAETTPPKMWAVIDEAILHRIIGDPTIMHHQLKSLVETAGLPHVTLQLLSFAGGAHAGLDGDPAEHLQVRSRVAADRG